MNVYTPAFFVSAGSCWRPYQVRELIGEGSTAGELEMMCNRGDLAIDDLAWALIATLSDEGMTEYIVWAIDRSRTAGLLRGVVNAMTNIPSCELRRWSIAFCGYEVVAKTAKGCPADDLWAYTDKLMELHRAGLEVSP